MRRFDVRLLLAALTLGSAPLAAEEPATGAPLPPPTVRRLGAPGVGAPQPLEVVTPGGGTFASPDGGRSWQPVRPAGPARPASGTRILSVEAVPQAVTGGGRELRVGTRFLLEGDQGRAFYVNVLFFDARDGKVLTSRLPAFADRGTGALLLLSQPMVHAVPSGEYQADLQVPYGALPDAAGGVEARVSLFRRATGGGADEVLDWTTAPVALLRDGAAAPAATAFPPAATAFPPPAPAAPPLTVIAREAPLPSAAPAGAGGTRIVELTKNHNLAMLDGTLGLRLDVKLTIDGPAGPYHLTASFDDVATGRRVRSLRPSFADPATGELVVRTQPLRHPGGRQDYATSLWVPYGAFPNPGPSAEAEIEAQVLLWPGEAAGSGTAAVGLAATRFRVHGS